MKSLNSRELVARLESGEKLLLLDVREPQEFSICHIPGSINIPMHSVPSRLEEIAPDATIVTICHHGMRSAAVQNFLIGRGLNDVINLQGGVDAFAQDVDPTMTRY